MALHFFIPEMKVSNKANLERKGPLLIAANHPNSLVDALVLVTSFKNPVYSLARGDVFKNSFIKKILHKLYIFPVYRVSEGVENLSTNYDTFAACQEIFKKNGIVLIFSEGKCINEWHLRPLKKGTARLSIAAWQQNISLVILPTGLNYSSFRKFGKSVHLHFGEPIVNNSLPDSTTDGKQLKGFNTILNKELKQLVYEIPNDDIQQRKRVFEVKKTAVVSILLFIPALFGFLLHWPLSVFTKVVLSRMKNSDHYDSFLFAILLFFYPLYLLSLALLVSIFIDGLTGLLTIPLLLVTGWSYTKFKKLI